MAGNLRRYQARWVRKAERKGRKKALLLWLIVLIVLGAGVTLFAVNCYGSTAVRLRKLTYPQKYSEYVEKAARDYSLPPALIYAVCRTESNFNAEAQSSVGARGVMQMMPETFEWLMEKRGEAGRYTADDLYDPAVCIDYGSYLLRFFYDTYGSERCAVAAYNAGFVVGDWLQNPNLSPDGVTLENIPYPETADYVEKVESAKRAYQHLYETKNDDG